MSAQLLTEKARYYTMHNKHCEVSKGQPLDPTTIVASPPLPHLESVVLSAFGGMVKSIFSDTTMVVAGTVLTLAVCLGGEEDSDPRRFAGGLWGVFGRLIFGTDDQGGLKEL